MATPAEPVLASTLFHILNDLNKSEKRKRLGAACSIIDDALHGGIDYGRVTCISGEKGTGKTTLSLHLLASHLLASPTAQAAVVDTAGTFDVLRLYQAIILHLNAQSAVSRAGEKDVENLAEIALARVKIMRVFDFVGMSEAINELSIDLQPPRPESPVIQQEVDLPKEIPDSEDDDDDMLFDIPKKISAPEEIVGKEGSLSGGAGHGLILIDNLAQLVNPLLKSNYAKGQALFTTFMRSLSHLTTSHQHSTILINTAASPRPSYVAQASISAPQSTWINDPTAQPPTIFDQPSIFAGSSARPVLGKPFTYSIDLHLLLSVLPKARKDSEIVFGGKTGRADSVNVLEVLGDRWEGRLGRWAAFIIEKDVGLKAAF